MNKKYTRYILKGENVIRTVRKTAPKYTDKQKVEQKQNFDLLVKTNGCLPMAVKLL